jgi:hypothetical protein
MPKAHIRIRLDNPGKDIEIAIDEDKLWDLFTKTIPGIEGRLQGLEGKLSLACSILFVMMAGGFSVLGLLIGLK